MCVIFLVNDVRPTEEMVRRAYTHNKDGGGMAWREGKDEATEVVFKKGLTEDEMVNLCARVPVPYVAHFRVASVGGAKAKLTHPFLVADGVPLPLEGRTKGKVLFHNGHWNPWAEKALDTAIHANLEVPEGIWSDTRALAWMTHIYGDHVMNLIPNQKGILYGPYGFKIFPGDGWEKINEVWCSNDFFFRRGVRTVYSGNRICADGPCMKEALPGTSFCKEHEVGPPHTYTRPPTQVTTQKQIGGTDSKFVPLVQNGIIKQTELEILYRRSEISKSLKKRMTALYGIVQQDKISPSKLRKATKALQEYSQVILSKLLNGREA